MSTQPFEHSPSVLIEFEEIEPSEAAKPNQTPATGSLDNDPLSLNYGRDKAHKPAAAERMLAGPTIDWLVSFPMEARPKALCERFAHVANRLARDWSDAARSAGNLRALVGDSRWGSAGYPMQIQLELQRLQQLLTTARQPG